MTVTEQEHIDAIASALSEAWSRDTAEKIVAAIKDLAAPRAEAPEPNPERNEHVAMILAEGRSPRELAEVLAQRGNSMARAHQPAAREGWETMKRMTEARLRKIAKALGWEENVIDGPRNLRRWRFPNGRFMWSDQITEVDECLAAEIAAGWAKAKFGVNIEAVGRNCELKFAGSADREFTATSPRLERAILAAAIDWADAGCPGGKK